MALEARVPGKRVIDGKAAPYEKGDQCGRHDEATAPQRSVVPAPFRVICSFHRVLAVCRTICKFTPVEPSEPIATQDPVVGQLIPETPSTSG